MNKPRILIVDDEDVGRESLSEILCLEGYYVVGVPNGQQALDAIRQEHFDLMIVDLRMPGMSGVDLIRLVNQMNEDIAIILLTAYPSVDSAIDALRERVHDYLQKPVTPREILDSVQRGLVQRQQRLENMKPGRGKITRYGFPGGIEVDLQARTIAQPGRETIFLTPAEGRLLGVFLQRPGEVLSHRELVLLVQGYETSVTEAPEILRPLVSRLRNKLEQVPELSQCIRSVRATGYVFDCLDSEPLG